VLYAVLRTVVEVFRGDVERGVWAGLGAGQWTSFAILAAGAAVWVAGRRGRPAPVAEAGAA
jgi:phosphatidylglycerol:prolipoprotein diacylglycerol transferase